MNSIIRELGRLEKFQDYIEDVKNKKSPIVLSGLTDVGMIQVIEGAVQNIKRPACIITYNEIQARKLVKDFKYFADEVYFFPKKVKV